MNQQPQTIDLEQLYNSLQKENQDLVERINKNNLVITMINEVGNLREQNKSYKALHEALSNADEETSTQE